MRRGPTYVENGYVIGHVQSNDLGGSFYLHQFEIIRKATLWERIAWLLAGRAPKID